MAGSVHLLPLLNSGRIELLDHQRLVAQLCGLERRTSRAGKDSIDHVPGSFDDVANCVAGAAVLAAQAAAHPQPPIVAPAFWSSRRGWIGSGQPTYDFGPDIGRLTQGPPPGSADSLREW
jgi:hypothetical protein